MCTQIGTASWLSKHAQNRTDAWALTHLEVEIQDGGHVRPFWKALERKNTHTQTAIVNIIKYCHHLPKAFIWGGKTGAAITTSSSYYSVQP